MNVKKSLIFLTNYIVPFVFYCILLRAFIGWSVGLGYKIQTMPDICNCWSIRSVFLCVATHYVCKCWTGDPCQHNDGGAVCRYNQTRQINPRLRRCPPSKHLDKQSLIKSWYNSIILNVNRSKDRHTQTIRRLILSWTFVRRTFVTQIEIRIGIQAVRPPVVYFPLGNSPAPEFYMPTFRNTLLVPSS